MTRSNIRPAAVLLAAFAVAGCNGGEGTLKGTVTYQGRPVIYGSVIAVGADGIQRKGGIRTDGSYEMEHLPAGVVKLCVLSPEPPDRSSLPPEMQRPPNGPGGAPPDLVRPDKSKWTKLPDQYADPDASGLTTTVKNGDNHFDIELK